MEIRIAPLSPAVLEALEAYNAIMGEWNRADGRSKRGKRLAALADRAWARYERRLASSEAAVRREFGF